MKKIMFNEVWKDVDGFEGLYEVSNLGNVRRFDTKKAKVKSLNIYGYPQVNLYKNGKAYLRRVHRLVAIAFIPNPDNLPMINHKDENPCNNVVDNLEWCDAKYNVNYGGGNEKRALSHSKPVLQYSLTGQLIKEWHSATEAARELGFPQSGINWCCLRKPKHNSCKGYIWRFKNDKSPFVFKNGKRVVQMDKNGTFIKEFSNITSAVMETGILATSISNCIHGRASLAGGYKWSLI